MYGAQEAHSVPLTVFRLFVPQGSSAAPGWFVKVVDEGIEGLEQVAAYFDHVITVVFDADASSAQVTQHEGAF